jgi:ABC transporter with metal-binding/Fe-S-binding domain ATP-binding protein
MLRQGLRQNVKGTRVAALFSGGKDSTYAAWLSWKEHTLSCLVTVFPKVEDSYMFHYPNLEWTRLQANAIGVPQITEETQGVKEEELKDLKRALSRAKATYGVNAVCTGALASVYQKTRVERACAELGLDCLSPLWGIDPEAHLRRLVADGFVAMVVGVSALGLDEKWLGRVLDGEAVGELVSLAKKFRFHAGLEGGEGETFVLDCPLFRGKITVRESVKHWRGDSGYLEITKASLAPK